jgi:hypothetical protein
MACRLRLRYGAVGKPNHALYGPLEGLKWPMTSFPDEQDVLVPSVDCPTSVLIYKNLFGRAKLMRKRTYGILVLSFSHSR